MSNSTESVEKLDDVLKPSGTDESTSESDSKLNEDMAEISSDLASSPESYESDDSNGYAVYDESGSEDTAETSSDQGEDASDNDGYGEDSSDLTSLPESHESDDSSERQQDELVISQEEIKETIAEIERLLNQGKEGQEPEVRTLADLVLEQTYVIGTRLLELTEVPKKVKLEKARAESAKLEKGLGISDVGDRILEASLFVDPPFLKVLALQGDAHPEEAFGVEAWQSWLKARAEARKIERLDLDTVVRLHGLVAAGLGEAVAGHLREEGVVGGDYTNLGSPIHLEQAQINVLSDNPLVRFKKTSETADEGLLVYPAASDPESFETCLLYLPEAVRAKERENKTTASLVPALLAEVLARHNAEDDRLRTAKQDMDPTEFESRVVALAATLQNLVVSTHPFRDGNGRLSRLLMNWVLEKHGLSPSILEHCEDDLFYSSTEWLDQVEAGVHKYQDSFKNKGRPSLAGIPNALFAKEDVQFYQKFYGDYGERAPLAEDGLKHEPYRQFLIRFLEAAAKFSEWSSYRVYRGEFCHFGGLVPVREFIAGYNTTPEGRQQAEELYYEDVKAYRGGRCQGVTDPHEFLEMFTSPVAFNTSYRPLLEEGLSPISLQKPSLPKIRQAAEDYNASLLSDYAIQGSRPNLDLDHMDVEENRLHTALISRETADAYLVGEEAATHLRREREIWREASQVGPTTYDSAGRGNLQAALSKGSYTALLLDKHSTGGDQLWLSPVVSASFDYYIAREFADKADESGGDEYAVLVTFQLPKKGAIYVPQIKAARAFRVGTYDWEHANEDEVLVVGGITPNSISEVELRKGGEAIATIKRTHEDEITYTASETGKEETFIFGPEGKLRPKPQAS